MSIKSKYPNSSRVLSENELLNKSYFSHHGYVSHKDPLQLISIKSSFKGFLFIIKDNTELGKIIFDEGVQNIPYYFEPGEMDYFVRPYNDVEDNEFTTRDVEIYLI